MTGVLQCSSSPGGDPDRPGDAVAMAVAAGAAGARRARAVTYTVPLHSSGSTGFQEVVLHVNRDDHLAGMSRIEVTIGVEHDAEDVAQSVIDLLALAAMRVSTSFDRVQEQLGGGTASIVANAEAACEPATSADNQATRSVLTEAQWTRVLQAIFPTHNGRRMHRPQGIRRFIESVLWVVCSDCVWCDLPPEHGHWRSVYVRFIRWSSSGMWPHVAAAIGDQGGPGRLLLDRHNRYLAEAMKIRQRRRIARPA